MQDDDHIYSSSAPSYAPIEALGGPFSRMDLRRQSVHGGTISSDRDFSLPHPLMEDSLSSSSSSGSATAPTDFNVYPSDTENSVHMAVPMERCGLCKQMRKNFYCAECVRVGEITHSKAKLPQKFLDKMLRLSVYERDLKNHSLMIEERSKSFRIMDELHQKIALTKQRIEARKIMIERVKRESEVAQHETMILTQECGRIRRRKAEMPHKKRTCEAANKKYEDDARAKKEKLEVLRKKISEKVRERIQELTTYIFPIEERESAPKEEKDGALKLLEEACQTVYIRGRWVTHQSVDSQYSVGGPCLPADGNYSQLVHWVQQHQEHNSLLKPAYEVSAALMHVCQLVSVLSMYLDLKLPYRCTFSEFAATTLNEEELGNKIARLNANVVYMCSSQNVDATRIRPEQTIRNIINLLQQTNLVRNEAFEMSSELTLSIEETLSKHLVLYDVHTELEKVIDPQNKTESGQGDDEEWEQVVAGVGVPSSIEASSQMSRYTYSTTASVLTRHTSQGATNLFNSAASYVNNFFGGS